MNAKLCLILAFLLAASSARAQTMPALPRGAESTEARLLTKVGPQTRAAIKQEAGKQTFDPVLATKAVQARTGRSTLAAGDIEILTYLLLMEATRSSQEDLKAIMNSVKQIDAAKSRLRQTPQTSRSVNTSRPTMDQSAIRPYPVPKAEMDTKIETVKNDLDSLSEMGEMESLRLQMAMDRRSKMMTTLSNLLKKISDTAASLTQNLK